jgi:hypothetical protein
VLRELEQLLALVDEAETAEAVGALELQVEQEASAVLAQFCCTGRNDI